MSMSNTTKLVKEILADQALDIRMLKDVNNRKW